VRITAQLSTNGDDEIGRERHDGSELGILGVSDRAEAPQHAQPALRPKGMRQASILDRDAKRTKPTPNFMAE